MKLTIIEPKLKQTDKLRVCAYARVSSVWPIRWI